MSKPVDKSKKSNIKCEHCLFADEDKKLGYYCSIHDKSKTIGTGVRILSGTLNISEVMLYEYF